MTLVRHTGPGIPATYDILVFDGIGQVRAKASAALPSLEQHLAEVNVAGQAVYYQDGDTKLAQLMFDGSSRQVATLPGGPDDRVVVAVEPGNSGRIAIGVNHNQPPPGCTIPSGGTGYCPGPTTTRLEIGTLGSRDYRVVNGPGDPIGWRNDEIVTAQMALNIQNEGSENPYHASRIWLVDPDTGASKDVTARCEAAGDALVGPFTDAGIACRHQADSITAIGWDGVEKVMLAPVPRGLLGGALAPDGHAIAVAVQPSTPLGPSGPRAPVPSGPSGPSGSHVAAMQMAIVSGANVDWLNAAGVCYGWLDETHLLSGDPNSGNSASMAVVDLSVKAAVPLNQSGLSPGFVPPFGAYFAALGAT